MLAFSEEEVAEVLNEFRIGDDTISNVTGNQSRDFLHGVNIYEPQLVQTTTNFEPQEEEEEGQFTTNNSQEEEINCSKIASQRLGFDCERLDLESASRSLLRKALSDGSQQLDPSQVASKIIVKSVSWASDLTELVTVDVIANGAPEELTAVDRLSNIEKRAQISYSFVNYTANRNGDISHTGTGIGGDQLILPDNILIIRHPVLKFPAGQELIKQICRFPVKENTDAKFTNIEISPSGAELLFKVEVGQKSIEESFTESQISNESVIMGRKLEVSGSSSSGADRKRVKLVCREKYQQPAQGLQGYINSDDPQYVSDPMRLVYKISPPQPIKIVSNANGSMQDHQIQRTLKLPQIANTKNQNNSPFQLSKPQNLQSLDSNGFNKEIYTNQQSLPHLTQFPLVLEQPDQHFAIQQGMQQQTIFTQNDLPQLPTPVTFHPKPILETLPPPNRERYSPGKLIVCKHCGTTSADMHYCERCKKRLPEEAKIIDEKNGISPAKPQDQPTTSTTNQQPTASTSQTADSSQPDNLLLLSYEGKMKIEIYQQDILCLRAQQFLNDSILDLWIRYIEHEMMSYVDQQRSYIFSTFFYKTLTTRPKVKVKIEMDPSATASEKRHHRVRRWTKQVDIFSKDFLIFPINENLHWFLAVVCFPGLMGSHDIETGEPISNDKKLTSGNASSSKAENSQIPTLSKNQERPKIKRPCILVLDSLYTESRSRVYATLREYLKVEYKIKKGKTGVFTKASMPGSMLKVPQQPNHCDCGVYLLYYLENFFRSPIPSFDIPIQGGRLMWPHDEEIAFKRENIYNTIIQLIKKTNPTALSLVPRLTFVKPSRTVEELSKQEQPIESAPVQKLDKVSPKEEPMDVDVDGTERSKPQNAILSQEMQLELSATISTAQNSKSDEHESADREESSSGINI